MIFRPCFCSWLARGLLAFAALIPLPVFAENQRVDSLAALQTAISRAVPGDTITLKDGAYITQSPIIINRQGAAGQPITIAAETVGGVELSGTHGFDVATPATYVVITGFKLIHASGKNLIGADTSHVRFTRNTFACTGTGPYLTVVGDDAKIDYNEFRDKKTSGSMLAVGGTGAQVARRALIAHNYFHDLNTSGDTVNEMVRFGLSTLSASNGAGVVEHNLFVRCRGDNELISNRVSGITYRYNTFLDSPTAKFTLRHGNACAIYGNYFRNTEGLRIFGDRHQIYSNYIEGTYLGINLGNGSVDVDQGGAANGHDRPDGCVIAFNTLVNNRTHYQMSRRTPTALGATNTTFANNLLVGGETAAKIEGPNPGAIWTGNVLSHVSDAGDLPASGHTSVDPMLTVDADGLYRLPAANPLTGQAVGEFPGVTVDIDGQLRPEKKTPGADEFEAGLTHSRLLTASDVGPEAAPEDDSSAPLSPPTGS